MAGRGVKNSVPYEGMDKMSSSTLKRSPKMDLNKTDLLQLLSYLEGELQARDISIAALKAEKSKQLVYQAKYGRFGLGDPFNALQRDSDAQRDNTFDEAAVKGMYDNQLLQLENLIETQQRAQLRMREQLVAVEKRYHKVCAELEDEKRKHAQDTAQGDDVTYLLEKERERLKQELEFEKSQNKKLDKEGKKSTSALDEERASSTRHKQVAMHLIKERKRLGVVLVQLQQQLLSVDEARKAAELRADKMEASMEKQLAEFDTEREQCKAKLAREERRCSALTSEVERLRGQLEELVNRGGGAMTAGAAERVASPSFVGTARIVPVPQPRALLKNTPPGTPPEVRKVSSLHMMRESPDRELSAARTSVVDNNHEGSSMPSSAVKRAILQVGGKGDLTADGRPVPAEKPADLVGSSGAMNAPSNPSSSSTVFTTPSGTRISLNVGSPAQSPTPSGTRKPAPQGRGQPPPVPPNKPQVFIPQTGLSGSRSPSAAMALPRPAPQPYAGPNATQTPPPAAGNLASRPQQPTKFGITISKDRITISNANDSANSPGSDSCHVNSSSQRPLLPAAAADRKSSSGSQQVCVQLK